MTTATDRTTTDRTTIDRTASPDTFAGSDFESTRTFTASAADVLAALRTTEAISGWWAPATGSADPRGTLEVASRSGSRLLELYVEVAEQGRVEWSVRLSTMTPEWVGTTIAFAVEDTDEGSTLHFRHHGLTPQCDCFDMCDAGWTSALDRLETFVATGQVAYARDSFQSTKSIERVAGSGARRAAHTGGRRGLVGHLRRLGRGRRDTGRVLPTWAAADRHGGPARAGGAGHLGRA